MLPQYDYIYLGDNARAPYGNRSFELVYLFTWEAVQWFFSQNCNLVIIACNTASAKALRNIQQKNLPLYDPKRRVLGIIRPTAEYIADISENGHVGVMGTRGTIDSKSYDIEIAKLHPHLKLSGEACPMWVPLVENKEYDKPGADYFVKQHVDNLLQKDNLIDAIILGCTHYPLLIDKIKKFIPQNIKIISQGKYVANSLREYLLRHPEMDAMCSKNGTVSYFTTESTEKFTESASLFLNENIVSKKITLSQQ